MMAGATRPYNIEVWGGDSQVKVSNLIFEYVGLRCYSSYGMEVTDCLLQTIQEAKVPP